MVLSALNQGMLCDIFYCSKVNIQYGHLEHFPFFFLIFLKLFTLPWLKLAFLHVNSCLCGMKILLSFPPF